MYLFSVVVLVSLIFGNIGLYFFVPALYVKLCHLVIHFFCKIGYVMILFHCYEYDLVRRVEFDLQCQINYERLHVNLNSQSLGTNLISNSHYVLPFARTSMFIIRAMLVPPYVHTEPTKNAHLAHWKSNFYIGT